MRNYRSIAAVLGCIVSLYAIYVEYMHEQDDGYEAMCDIGSVSCSRVLTSEYGHIFSHVGLFPKGSLLDQSNAFYGFVFYCIIFFFSRQKERSSSIVFLNLALSTMGFTLSVVLAYILAAILVDFCIICVSTYVFNAVILFDCIMEVVRPARAKVE